MEKILIGTRERSEEKNTKKVACSEVVRLGRVGWRKMEKSDEKHEDRGE